ncbi:MAG TPA: NUDIX hydrolase [Opitutaceae bacterium]|nr:NUDIX hydrolase [Opitutaceae bacterium]
MKLTKRYQERFHKNLHLYKGKAVGFRADQIKIPGNRLAQREFLAHPGAVGVLAFESPQKIILVKQYRYPVRQFTYEIPAGKLSQGEDSGACVRRELEEETGFRARKISKLMSYWPTAAFSTEVIHLYVATGLFPTRANPDEDEFIELVRVSPKQLEGWMRSGKIRDSKTLIAYLAWKALK